MFISSTVTWSMTFHTVIYNLMWNISHFAYIKSCPHIKVFSSLTVEARTRLSLSSFWPCGFQNVWKATWEKTTTYFKLVLEDILLFKWIISNVNFTQKVMQQRPRHTHYLRCYELLFLPPANEGVHQSVSCQPGLTASLTRSPLFVEEMLGVTSLGPHPHIILD